MPSGSPTWLALLLPGLLLAGTGCAARVQHALDERQANEIQTVLVERGFRARKVVEDGRPPTWAVEVPSADAADAVRVLAELGLPRARPAGVRELLKPGLVPDPMEQHALLLEAQSGELARTLEAVDGVVSARVHLVRPQASRAGAPAAPTKAAVYLRAQPAAAAHLQAMRDELRSLVAGSVEGLEPAAVTLVVSEVVSTVPPRAGAPVRSSWAPALLGAGVLLLAGLGAAGLLWMRRRRLKGSQAEMPPTTLGLRPVVQGPLARREVG
ncbi:MAG TPA: flagellar M-ring protein FliF [Myxococcaceae bacterium]|nr:flagellar M-ring protein FliF [Myxococcaceae bacterium]